MKQPNVVIITLHDTGRHFGAYGQPTVSSDHFDRIGRQGVLLTDHFCPTPICSASRAAMLTGLLPIHSGQLDLPVWGYDLKPGVRHLSQLLHNADYSTHLFGIQHETADIGRLAFDTVWRPENRGYGSADVVAEQIVSFLESRRDTRPMYLQIGLFETHSPFDFANCPEDRSRGVAVPRWIKPTPPALDLMAKFQGALKRADDAVGRIDDTLHRLGLADDTLLIYTTDHGVELPRAKWTLFDPGVEVGLAARWPAGRIVGGRRCDTLSSHIDITPTILDLVGAPVPPGLDGRSLARAWRAEPDPHAVDAVFGFYLKSESRSIRTRTHKLILNAGVRTEHAPPVDISDTSRNNVVPPIQLFDLKRDPLESENRVGDPALAAVEKSLFDRLWSHLVRTDDLLLQGPLEMAWRRNAVAEFHRRASEMA